MCRSRPKAHGAFEGVAWSTDVEFETGGGCEITGAASGGEKEGARRTLLVAGAAAVDRPLPPLPLPPLPPLPTPPWGEARGDAVAVDADAGAAEVDELRCNGTAAEEDA